MREFKFRAWNGKEYIYSGSNLDNNNKLDLFFAVFGLSDIVIEQYIGLKDENGKEIYEGDIVNTKAMSNDHNQLGATSIWEIFYFMGNACFRYKKSDTGTPIYPINVDHEIQVIGNINESPELLK